MLLVADTHTHTHASNAFKRTLARQKWDSKTPLTKKKYCLYYARLLFYFQFSMVTHTRMRALALSLLDRNRRRTRPTTFKDCDSDSPVARHEIRNSCGFKIPDSKSEEHIVQELCESRGGRPGLSVRTSFLASVDVKIYWTMLRHWSQLVPNMSADIRGH